MYPSLSDQIIESASSILGKADHKKAVNIEDFKEVAQLIKRLVLLGSDVLDCQDEKILLDGLYKCKRAGQNIRAVQFNHDAYIALEKIIKILDRNTPETSLI